MMSLSSKLDPLNVESRHFLSFSFPPNAQLEDKSALSEWMERMVFLYEDLKWLLSLPVDFFWNQVTFDTSWHVCLDSFLFNSPRSYDLKNVLESCKTALIRISKLFLLAIKRMSLYNEDPMLCFSQEEFADIIYENYLFDAAKLLDICSIFYRPGSTVGGVVKEIIHNIFTAQPKYFDDINNAVESMIFTVSNIEDKLKICESLNASKHLKGNSVNGREAQDMMLFSFDMVNTFLSLLRVLPSVSQVMFKVKVVERLVTTCENILPCLLNLIQVNRKKYKYILSEIEKSVTTLIDTIIEEGYVQNLQNKSTDVTTEDLTTAFISMMDTIAQYPNFLVCYCKLGKISNIFEMIEEVGCIDMSSLKYVRGMISSSVSESDSSSILHQLRVLLPMKGEEYLSKCVEKYGPNVDVIVNNVLEGNMPEEKKTEVSTKKQISVPNKDVLEDKEHVALLKSQLLTPLDDDSTDEDGYNVYDDEYDDTYDSQNVAAADADSADELKDLTSRRKFTIPAALRQIGDVSSESEEEEEEKGGSEELKNKREVSENGQRQGNANYRGGYRGNRGRTRGHVGNSGGNRGGGNRGGGNRGASNNDQGSDRGRGRGRGNKHNRRRLADKKKSKGMMPF
ncbi:activating signal cointegrator 1 complex subunit 2-like [Hydractinia symbiolongicarpus]|uniref:activating signal cointegrator 1 complex subunit 2-like n=1 Tax=Hydractinia symbiolongicarpus TaxID=13093 RepID=UPI00254F7BF2|nr:activating signal cointegrator 1 complex subunit 2-like [Hydractinia symbiolongicarpus]